MRLQSIIFALENVFFFKYRAEHLNEYKNSIKIKVLRTINMIYELSGVVTLCLLRWRCYEI